MVKVNCFICKRSTSDLKRSLLSRLTQHSKVPILKFVSENLDYDLTKEESGICSLCLKEVNILDLYTKKEDDLLKSILNKLQYTSEKKLLKKIEVKSEDETVSVNSNFEEIPEQQDSSIDEENSTDLKNLKEDDETIISVEENKIDIVQKEQNSYNEIVEKKSTKRKKEVQTSFECPKCQKDFKRKNLLRQHLRLTHGTFPCDICGVTLGTRLDLKNHTKIHRENISYDCKICGKNYTQKVGLISHMTKHTGETKYQCDECGKQFRLESTLKYHKLTHGDIRTQKCTICGLELRTAHHLKRHMMTHSGEKPHSCPVCNQKFACLFNMKVHLKTHDGVAPIRKKHQCNICLKEFPRKIKLNEHLALAHQTVVEPENVEDKE